MCDTMAIVGSDGVLFAKNSDRDANEAQYLDWQPRRSYAPGEELKCTWIDIPQARQTNAVLLSRPWWMWGAEMGTNEHGVTIGNEAVFTRAGYSKTGLTGMDLLRLALERSNTAAAAVQTIVDLLVEYGQGGLCSLERRGFTYHNSYIVADPRQAFVLETAGRHHAAEEVRGARSISNGLTIPGFAEQYSDRLKTYFSACKLRRKRTQEMADRAEDVADLARALRDHGAGCQSPQYFWTNGGLRAPCVHAGGYVASSQTAASWIAELRPGAVRHWATATAAPCTGLFKPISIDEPLELAGPPTDHADDESLWWRHERLHRTVVRDSTRLGARYFAERNEIETAWFATLPSSSIAFAAGDQLLARWTLDVAAVAGADTRPGFVRRYWDKRNAQAGIEFGNTARASRVNQSVTT